MKTMKLNRLHRFALSVLLYTELRRTLPDPEHVTCTRSTHTFMRSCRNRPKNRPKIVGLPRKQKIAVNKFWVQESKIGEECRQFWT